jgi:Tol biopolymer transport system component
MKRLAPFALVVLALAIAACSVGEPKPPTYLSDHGATFNANVHSSIDGPMQYWFAYGAPGQQSTETPRRTLTIGDRDPHPVSEPVAGLTAATTYDWQICVADQGEDPPRSICSKIQSVTTAPAGGVSGIAFTSRRDGNDEIYVMGTNGSNQTNLTNAPASADIEPAWSPDGKRIAFASDRDGNTEIYVMDADGGNQTRLTNNTSSDDNPVWSPDGSRIAFTAFRGGNYEIYVMDTAGGNQTNLSHRTPSDLNPTWSPDGSRIAFSSDSDSPMQFNVWLMDAAGGNQTNLTNFETVGNFDVAWSPRGDRIAYNVPRNVISIGAGGGDFLLHTDNGLFVTSARPTWSPDGGVIAFERKESNRALEIAVVPAGVPSAAQTNITSNDVQDYDPAWSPRP